MDAPSTSSGGPDHLPAAAILAAAAALSDELRRQMYAYIRQARRPVSREEAAEWVGISDKLVEVGLLRAHYERVDGIRKVGRAPKLYEPADAELQISIPAREHDLLAD